MVVIHEFGHFIVAKMLGISVETFSVGFGKRLLGFKWGETDYRLSAIPLGGYVKFRGENMEMIQGKSEGSVEEFLAHPKWKRFLVALAGPVFNIATAILIPAISILIGYRANVAMLQQPVVGQVSHGTAAEKAGLVSGDKILSFAGKNNPAWDDIQQAIVLRPNENISAKIERQGKVIDVNYIPKPLLLPKENETIGEIDIFPHIAMNGVRVLKVPNDTPASKAGLKAGDLIKEIAGNKVTDWYQFRNEINNSKGQPVNLKVERDKSIVSMNIAASNNNGEYLLGFNPDMAIVVKTSSLFTALKYGWDYNIKVLQTTGVALKQIVEGKRSARNALGGPIKIAQTTMETHESMGWAGTIPLMGFLSLNLGIFNLLPIPILDGGAILLIIIESILGLAGLSISMNFRERFQQVGFVMVMLLMGFVIINDITGLTKRLTDKPAVETQQKPASK